MRPDPIQITMLREGDRNRLVVARHAVTVARGDLHLRASGPRAGGADADEKAYRTGRDAAERR
jgi:hypothetical protein